MWLAWSAWPSTPMRLSVSRGAIADLTAQYHVPCIETQWMKDRDYAALLADEWQADVAFIVGCRVLISRAVYEAPRLGSLAVHDSLLPEYRGFAPLNWAILNGEDHTGVTLFYLSEAMDDGDIVLQQSVPIGPDETAPQVYAKVCQATIDVVLDGHARLLAGDARAFRRLLALAATRAAAPRWMAALTGIVPQLRSIT